MGCARYKGFAGIQMGSDFIKSVMSFGYTYGRLEFYLTGTLLGIYKESLAVKSIGVTFYYLIWSKARSLYYLNNWVYTTNHKRIAVNYFWFVILSGVCGMILATIIRLEMAYPGVGVLAGDSLQYLSIVTAHAVVMVFFMIMPLIFGAFGNFLLPTQLGVHDVAFPRLNSAAFWFLPAGLVMLCQLVCLDRRYQRMNCFNIREVESLLKSRFFPDLVNSQDYRRLLTNTMVNLRFKAAALEPLDTNLGLFTRYGLDLAVKLKAVSSLPIGDTDAYSFSPSASPFSFFCRPLLPAYSVYLSVRSLPTAIFWDTQAFSSYFLLMRRDGAPTVRMGFFNAVELAAFFLTTLKTEFERQAVAAVFVTSSTKNFADTWAWFSYWRPKFLDQFLYGYMQGNMGTYKLMTRLWPAPRDPDIAILGGFVEFYVTGLDKLGSRTIFLYCKVIKGEFVLFACRLVSGLFHAFMGFLYEAARLALVKPVLPFTFVENYSLMLSLYLKVDSTAFAGLPVRVANYVPSASAFTAVRPDWSRPVPEGESLPSSSTGWEATAFCTSNSARGAAEGGSVHRFSEKSEKFRALRALNPLFRYDYKVGNYFSKGDASTMAFLFPTIGDLTGGIRKSPWFFSALFLDLFSETFRAYSSLLKSPQVSLVTKKTATVQPTFATFGLFCNLNGLQSFIDSRHFAVLSVDQKFAGMFLTSSLQQRILANWRQLKFSREAWRCKLLAARHQKTLYKRYSDEDGIFWAIERNAKDVLPGWAMITPFSSRTRFTAIGKVDIGLFGVFLVLNSSIVSSANFLVTYRYLSTLNNRKMRDARSFFTEGVMVASWMMIAANPMLVIGILMLLSDRHWQTSFFDYSGGGDTVLFQHMFWFFGHPEVYVIMIPAFGFNNTVLSFYLKKRVSARASLLYSMYTIAFLGFFVWGHHMYMVGLAHTTRMLFSTLTVMISVPAATKLMHWCVTLVNSAFSVELPLLFMLLFIFFFISGGISGMAVANTGMDIFFHDTFYVVGHFHVMFAGSAMFASFGAFYFYFPSIFGVKFSRVYGYLHCLYYLIGQLMTVVPMMWLGYSGMPRRVLDYPAALGGWHAVVSAGHLLSVAGMTAFFVMIFDSLRQSRAATRNTFGVTRFNTRLNFYLYELARTKFIQRKGWFISRVNASNTLSLNEVRLNNYEHLETTLFSYTFRR